MYYIHFFFYSNINNNHYYFLELSSNFHYFFNLFAGCPKHKPENLSVRKYNLFKKQRRKTTYNISTNCANKNCCTDYLRNTLHFLPQPVQLFLHKRQLCCQKHHVIHRPRLVPSFNNDSRPSLQHPFDQSTNREAAIRFFNGRILFKTDRTRWNVNKCNSGDSHRNLANTQREYRDHLLQIDCYRYS